MKKTPEQNKTDFTDNLKKCIESKKDNNLDIKICIGASKEEYIDIPIKKIDFEFDWTEALSKYFGMYRIHLCFESITFKEQVYFKDITLETLSFKDVIFKKNVGIKENRINELIIRPYKIDAHIVVNNAGYAKDGLIQDPHNVFINSIEFEDPHVCNAKIYFIGISSETKCDFSNRSLDNVIFQNCNFSKTKFLNSFLKQATFLNCEFPLIANSINRILFRKGINKILFAFFMLFMAIMLYIDNHTAEPEYHTYILLVAYIIPMGYMIYTAIEFVGNIFVSLLIPNNTIGKHIGIYDEANITLDKEKTLDTQLFNKYYSNTTKNIINIYKDLKVNFNNNGDLQKAGDFYYSSNLLTIVLLERVIDTFILMLSYLINGFGERVLRGLFAITALLIFIGVYQNPNNDYISTFSTPNFLLENNASEDSKFIKHNLNNFKKISETIGYNKDDNKTYGYNNQFTFNDKSVYIPKLKIDDVRVRIYYALSHISTPFTTENKKWFNNTDKSHSLGIGISLLVWLYIMGVIKAIFNRIQR